MRKSANDVVCPAQLRSAIAPGEDRNFDQLLGRMSVPGALRSAIAPGEDRNVGDALTGWQVDMWLRSAIAPGEDRNLCDPSTVTIGSPAALGHRAGRGSQPPVHSAGASGR